MNRLWRDPADAEEQPPARSGTCPVCAKLDGARKLAAELDAKGIPVPRHLRPRDGGCGLEECQDQRVAP